MARNNGSPADLYLNSDGGSIYIGSSANNLFDINSGSFRVTSAGNIGVGTATPQAKLHVKGGRGFFETATGSNPFTIARVYKSSNFEELRFGVTDSVTTIHYINDETSNRIDFRMQNTDTEAGGGANANDNIVLSIIGNSSGGAVGVGTASPVEKLQVAGYVRGNTGLL